VNAGVAGGMNALLPGEAVLDEVGRADRAVVARRFGAVGGQPVASLGLEVVDGDHHRRTVVRPAVRIRVVRAVPT
jgi:hypothetical protein